MKTFIYVSGRTYQGRIKGSIVTVEATVPLSSSQKVWEIRDPEHQAILGLVDRGGEKTPDEHEFAITQIVDAYELGRRVATTKLQRDMRKLLGIGD